MIDYGHGVRLGPIDRAHLNQIRKWRNDFAVYKWCRQHDLISDVDQERWFERQNADSSIRMYMVYSEDERPVGVCGLTSLDLVNRRAEFSLYIAPQHRGDGLGKLALKTLISHGFNTYGLMSIWGESFEGNKAREMFTSLGFRLDGVRRAFYFREGKFIDAHLYSILSDEWAANPDFNREQRVIACSST